MQETTELSRVWTLWVSISIYWNWKREKFAKTTKLPEVEIFKDKQINKRQRLLSIPKNLKPNFDREKLKTVVDI